ncbi:unnamed protein product [Calicophoron daubneyi]|uniref:GT23 domain-containing protein n=1 Tax=Calicophoron daubneyi TaxID=300641 RepID=A0AAV2TE80_CALDB
MTFAALTVVLLTKYLTFSVLVTGTSSLGALTKERWSCPNTGSDQYTSTVYYHESLRRRSISTVGYMSKIALANLSRIEESANSSKAVEQLLLQAKSMARLIRNFLNHSTLYLLANLHKMEELDDARICRKEALNRLSYLVQARIKAIQNPPDCAHAKLLLADVSWPCGYGCHTHYFMFCLNMAYATGRTLISESLNTYCGKWWADSYMPFSDKCSMENVKEDEFIVGMNSANFNSSARVMRCTFEFFVHAQNVSVAPPAVPREIAPLLLTLHGRPGVWFLGQLAHYLMRPLPMFKSQLDHLVLSSKLTKNHDSPVVGVHVRRTDKRK